MSDIQEIKKTLKKNNHWKKLFLAIYKDKNFNIERLDCVFSKYKKYKGILNQNITPDWLLESYYLKKINPIELFEDEINVQILNYKYKRFIKKVNGYGLNKKSKQEIKFLLSGYMSEDELFFEIKKSNGNIDKVLPRLKKQYAKWNHKDYIKKIKKEKIKIISNTNNKIIVRLLDYKSCQNLGSKMWCITHNKYYYELYTSKFKVQYVIFDFNKEITDKSSMIGITVKPNGEIADAYYRDNTNVDKNLITDYLPGKPKNEILKELKKHDNQKAFEIICETGVDYLFEEYIQKKKYNFPYNLINKEKVKASNRLNNSFRMASKSGNINILKKIMNHRSMDKGIHPGTRNNYAVRWAAENDDFDTLSYLLSLEETDPTADANYAIRVAAEGGFLSIVNLLLADKRVDPTANDHYALRFAIRNNHHEIIEALIKDKRVLKTLDKEWLDKQLNKKRKM